MKIQYQPPYCGERREGRTLIKGSGPPYVSRANVPHSFEYFMVSIGMNNVSLIIHPGIQTYLLNILIRSSHDD